MKRERLVVLDALRAIAGLTVPMFHICEAFTRDPGRRLTFYCDHGYLAVEFFLILMGYMLGFAYDRRWSEGMGIGGFFRRRLIRLHPLVISGVAIGLVVAFVQMFTGANLMPWFKDAGACGLVGLALWAMTMIPVFSMSYLNPFNACSWTLYYEYAANVLYGLFVRRFGQKTLGVLAVLAAVFWLSFVFHWNPNNLFGTHLQLFTELSVRKNFTVATGWGTDGTQVYSAFARLLLPFFLGLFLSRTGWKIRLSKMTALIISIVVFIAVLYWPGRYVLGGPSRLWVNGLFEFVVVTVVFPLLLLVGVGAGTSPESRSSKAWAFLAELSYPLYMSHYMFITGLSNWVNKSAAAYSVPQLIGIQIAVYAAFIALGYAVMRWWDRPIQKCLGRFFR